MKVTKELAVKAKQYEKLNKELKELSKELRLFAENNTYSFEDLEIEGFGVAEEPKGEEIDEGIYCEQIGTNRGRYYYIVEESSMYLWVEYHY